MNVSVKHILAIVMLALMAGCTQMAWDKTSETNTLGGYRAFIELESFVDDFSDLFAYIRECMIVVDIFLHFSQMFWRVMVEQLLLLFIGYRAYGLYWPRESMRHLIGYGL
jgi:hypothetical protein